MSAWLIGTWWGTPTNTAPDEHEEIGWFRPAELGGISLAHGSLGALLMDSMRDQ